MTNDDFTPSWVKDFIQEYGYHYPGDDTRPFACALLELVAKAAQEEREVCAKIADLEAHAEKRIAREIRAQGKD